MNFIASQAIARQQAQQSGIGAGDDMDGQEVGGEKADAMAELERQARAPVGFVAATTGPEGGDRPQPQQDSAAALGVQNADAIDIDGDL